MKSRMQRFIKKANALFLATVVVPTALSAVYFGLMASDVYTSESSFVVRNWASLLMLVCGMAAMFSVVLVPLAPSSVLVALIGAACTACGFAGVLVLEVSWRLTDQVAAVLAGRKGASAVSP